MSGIFQKLKEQDSFKHGQGMSKIRPPPNNRRKGELTILDNFQTKKYGF